MNAHSSFRMLADHGWGRLEIDLGALRANYRALAARAAPARVAAVVKADAYGLGAERVSAALYAEGCRDFFVAHFVEALRLRPLLSLDARLYVLNGLQPGDEDVALERDIVPVLNSLEQVEQWNFTASRTGRQLAAALQVDSGMSRLGLSADELKTLVARPSLTAAIRITHVMSHLAEADEPEAPANAAQLSAFAAARAAFPQAIASFANSGGIFLGPDYHQDLARPGIALYGGVACRNQPEEIRPVVRLSIPVIQTRSVPAGTRIGYGGRHVAPGPMRIATLAAGYADGLPRHLSGCGAVYFEGQRLPILGSVSMDSMTVDVSAIEPGRITLGTPVEVIGPHQTLEMLAEAAGTIAYEILTRLGQRYARDYIQGETAA